MAGPVGEDWKEVLARVETLLVSKDQMNPGQRDFLYSMQARLKRYEEKTFMSRPQRAWVAQLEEIYLEGHPHAT